MVFTEQTPDPESFVQWEGSMSAEYRYTFGQAGEAFFRALQEEGEIRAAECPACDKRFLPPRIFCPECFGNLEDRDLVPVDGDATVERVTVNRLDLEGERLDEPEVYGLVSFEGVDGGILHRLLDVDPDGAEAGLAVEPVLEDRSEREGGIEDIRGFRPTG
jgi:uncharacterized OB-fold protein